MGRAAGRNAARAAPRRARMPPPRPRPRTPTARPASCRERRCRPNRATRGARAPPAAVDVTAPLLRLRSAAATATPGGHCPGQRRHIAEPGAQLGPEIARARRARTHCIRKPARLRRQGRWNERKLAARRRRARATRSKRGPRAAGRSGGAVRSHRPSSNVAEIVLDCKRNSPRSQQRSSTDAPKKKPRTRRGFSSHSSLRPSAYIIPPMSWPCGASAAFLLLLRRLGDHRLGRQQQTRPRTSRSAAPDA